VAVTATQTVGTILVGLAVGVLTLVGQRVLPGSRNAAANSGAVWFAVAFGVGAFMPSERLAVVMGFVTLAAAVARGARRRARRRLGDDRRR
jgi:hypothetical protein